MALTDKLTAIANAIRAKTGKTGTLTLEQMASEISNISTGLDDNELALATATITDVLTGKTFYSGDKELKTGTRNIGDKISQTVTVSLSQNAETNKTYTLTFSNLSKIDGINAMSFSVANRLVLYSFSISGNTISATFHNSSSASKTGSLSITAFQLI